MKIGIMGTPVNCGNRGVMALGTSLIELCSQPSPGGDVVLLQGHVNSEPAPFRHGGKVRLVPVVHARLSPRSHPRHHLFGILLRSVLYRMVPLEGVRASIARSTPWIKAVAEADFVGDVRGGDSFSDIYGINRFLVGFLMAWTVLLVKGTMVQFPQTYGPFKRQPVRWLARYLLRQSSAIIARDRKSRHLAQQLLGPRREVLLSPDVAFSLESIRPDRIEVDPPLDDKPASALIGINVNGLMFNGGYTRKNMFGLRLAYPEFLSALVEALLREHRGEIWLVPHTFAPDGNAESDPESCRRVRNALSLESQKRVRIVTAEYDCNEIKGVIGMCDFFIGSRMHSCIAALSQGIPCVAVAYSMKFAGVFETAGMEDWVIDGRTAKNEEAVARVLELYRQRNSVRAPLARRADEARARLLKIFRWLIATSGGTRNLDSVPHPDAAEEQEVLQMETEKMEVC